MVVVVSFLSFLLWLVCYMYYKRFLPMVMWYCTYLPSKATKSSASA